MAAPEAAQTAFCLTWLGTLKTGFTVMWLIYGPFIEVKKWVNYLLALQVVKIAVTSYGSQHDLLKVSQYGEQV